MKTLTSMILIGLLSALALYKGIDGWLLAVAFALIAGLGGYSAKELISRIKRS